MATVDRVLPWRRSAAPRDEVLGPLLDDQGHLRANVVIFVDGRRSGDRVALADPLSAHSRVHVLQALSGG